MENQLTARKLSSAALDYQRKMTNPIIYWFAMLVKLPSAVFWRLRIKDLTTEKCEVTIPFFWRSQNPFKSIYFAALAGAAELSTGALCQLALAGKGQFSMLVVDFRAEFSKKANSKITFSCTQGEELFELIEHLEVGESAQLTMISTGQNQGDETVARFFVTWSFKRKS
ncbi:protein of unknown function [Algoriphagus alkaliphilus]|uniref:Acyl-coenzyme A thioesterase PaaI, contains HGG motif n=1 Tax=Algoriphagus alkaliphilus TaxID=279824 RepID=A0A1G5XVC9_9BACT|nr:DUF4442 domain-containing protein [Algoriphagus alkaliphilus]SDA73824.1 protein of unknown function [Algoriphagus alkaliphilus]